MITKTQAGLGLLALLVLYNRNAVFNGFAWTAEFTSGINGIRQSLANK